MPADDPATAVLQVALSEVKSVKPGRRVYDNRGTQVYFLSKKDEVASKLKAEIGERLDQTSQKQDQR